MTLRPLPGELDDGLVGRSRNRRQRERPIGVEVVGARERFADELLAGRELDLVEDHFLLGVDAERAGVEHCRVRGIEARSMPSRRPAETVAYLHRASSDSDIPYTDTHQMREEYDDEFDDRRGLEARRDERRVSFQNCVHPVVLGIVVDGAATVLAHRVLGLCGIDVAGRALGDQAGQRPTTCEFFFDIRHRQYKWTETRPLVVR